VSDKLPVAILSSPTRLANEFSRLSPTRGLGVAEDDAVADTDPVKPRDRSPQRSSTMRSPSPAKWLRGEESTSQIGPSSQATTTARARSKSPAKSTGHRDLKYCSARSRNELDRERKAVREIDLDSETETASPRGRRQYGSIAERRQIPGPRPIDVHLAQLGLTEPDATAPPIAVPGPSAADLVLAHPKREGSPSRQAARQRNTQGPEPPRSYSSSLYSGDVSEQEEIKQAERPRVVELIQVSPLRHKSKEADLSPSRHATVLPSYTAWKHGQPFRTSVENEAQDKQQARLLVPRHPEHPRTEYSPLTPYFSTRDMPASTKASKTLIGDGGWLERTGAVSDDKTTLSPKKVGFLESLKKKAREIVVS
jgi:hypothetical protein